MIASECAEYWGFGLVLGFGLRWLFSLVRALMRTPSIVIGRD